MIRMRWKVWILFWTLISTGAGCGGGSGKKEVGATCASNQECASGACLPYNGNNLCSKPCMALQDCPKATACRDLGDTGSWCLPPVGCAPECGQLECGPDPACGTSCGDCTGGRVCREGACVCDGQASTGCHDGDVWWFDSCGRPETLLSDCRSGCQAGQCTGCAPECGLLECGPDPVCGASCGDCTGGRVCRGGVCLCSGQASTGCYNGDVWWFDSCGAAEIVKEACPFGCQDAGCLSCEPTSCAREGKDCGSIPDGCGGTLSCGDCAGVENCGGGGTPNVCGRTYKLCKMACQTAGDCATPSLPAYDADNYTCRDGACEYLGCNDDAECQATFQSAEYRCRVTDFVNQCINPCAAVSDCVGGAPPPAYDLDNYVCDGGLCIYTGCNDDAECQASYPELDLRCHDFGTGVPVCAYGCLEASDCNADLPEVIDGAFGPDNYACPEGVCWYLGCHEDSECLATYGASYPGRSWVCR